MGMRTGKSKTQRGGKAMKDIIQLETRVWEKREHQEKCAGISKGRGEAVTPKIASVNQEGGALYFVSTSETKTM